MNKTKTLKFDTNWSYSPALESTDHIELKDRYGLFIDGKFTSSKGGNYFDTINPANEKKLSEVSEANEKDVDKAVKAAQQSYEKVWSKMNPSERGKYIFRIARLIQERAREFAVIESMDGGKPIRESRDVDVPLAAAHFFYYAGWADKLDYAFPGRNTKSLGVAGQIIPWNFPLLMAAWKIAPALATGNTVVLKPAETTPLTALKLAEVIQEADLPPGVVNIITGGSKTGQMLVQHPCVNKVAFTGSTEVGKYIMKAVAGSEKKYTLELGGKAANIIFEDAALDQAVEGIINAIFFNQGHVCCAGSRLYVQESVAMEVLSKLKDRMETLVIGDPLDKNTDIGAINSRPQLEKICTYVDIGKKEGGLIYQPSCKLPGKGFWHAPTLFTDVSQSHRIVQEEIFGPVLAIQTFRTVDEAITKANNTPFGLSGGVWTDKGSKLFKVTREIRAGVIWANTFNKFDPGSPFGGYKESGMGREGGVEGLHSYVELV
ncbi:MAG TPA: aldehyde dehydrogenase family protein [Candidatus Marinimicrobia bacterium]|jgi:aldehyde dehydrogenase (NAD+)|nr:aldehyde dehydrogenase family protein [Candidatus Neomarinimicrobiota bacterium]MDP6261794.1 aldehyde dehydrogenase family protein [Candidatus Neomarinimicrobiota bacterium]MDP7127550.1 aldehyde dehydrogenase family protein [Candidatus Neomarinimicrobiota bacterium]MDP7337566.1 aldehyde dehydrogenase family protein [Candidatus Neomarinimicrobiota bacterium]MDP7475895.1 aldehyde dehydrogenase family protein [Candidatus Neomarinimicrobiota bacterium]